MVYSSTGRASVSESEGSRFDPWWTNQDVVTLIGLGCWAFTPDDEGSTPFDVIEDRVSGFRTLYATIDGKVTEVGCKPAP